MFDLAELLRSLRKADVRFIIVGGAAALLHRAPVTTVDLDIVHDREPENVDRLLAVLQRLDARIRDPAGGVIRPSASHSSLAQANAASPWASTLLVAYGPPNGAV